MVSLVRPKFCFLSWSDSHGRFGVEWNGTVYCWISLWAVWLVLMCFQHSNSSFLCRLIHWLFNKDPDQRIQWIRDIFFVFNFKETKIQIMFELMIKSVSISNFETRCSNSAVSLVQWWVPTVMLFFRCFFWKSGLLLGTIVCSGQLVFLFSPAWDAVKVWSNSPWTLDSSALSWSWTLPIKEQQR